MIWITLWKWNTLLKGLKINFLLINHSVFWYQIWVVLKIFHLISSWPVPRARICSIPSMTITACQLWIIWRIIGAVIIFLNCDIWRLTIRGAFLGNQILGRVLLDEPFDRRRWPEHRAPAGQGDQNAGCRKLLHKYPKNDNNKRQEPTPKYQTANNNSVSWD